MSLRPLSSVGKKTQTNKPKSKKPTSVKNSTNEKQKQRGLLRKLKFVKEKGGKCSICNYSKNLAALEFHHINPEIKSMNLDARHIRGRKIEVLENELEKCLLICSNCHRELHNPDLEMEILKEFPQKEKEESHSKNKTNKCNNCINCDKEFPKIKGKIFCSKECREKYKKYPSIEEIMKSYSTNNSWEKVAKEFEITRRVLQGIRNKSPQ